MTPSRSPIVSVLMPTYNHALFISQAIKSVLAQSIEDVEVIVLDDGSEDSTEEIVVRFHDSRVRYIRLPHAGVSNLGQLYNHGLTLARGRYIAILEGDDYWPPDKLARQIPLMKEFDFTWGTAAVVSEKDVVLRYSMPRTKGSVDGERFLLSLLLNRLGGTACTWLVRKDLLVEAGGFKQPTKFPAVDYPTVLHLAVAGGRFASIDEVLGYWRQHSSQITRRYRRELARATARYAWDFYTSYSHVNPFNLLRKDVFYRSYASWVLRTAATVIVNPNYGPVSRRVVTGGELARLACRSVIKGLGHRVLRRS